MSTPQEQTHTCKRRLEIGQTFVVKIPKEAIRNSHLSVPRWEELNGTNGFCRDEIRAETDAFAPRDSTGKRKLPYRGYDRDRCLYTYQAHLQALNLTPSDPWLTIGARNLGNNVRIVGYKAEAGLLQLNGENADKNNRDYTCLCMTHDGLSIESIKFTGGRPNREGIIWAVSGQELVRDGQKRPIDTIIPYTYDLRHVWRTSGARTIEQAPTWMPPMANCFVENMNKSPEELTHALKALIKQRRFELEREHHYLHSAIGIDHSGNVLIVQRHGAFEAVAQTLIDAGADRAIELDQGGSVSTILGAAPASTYGRTVFASHYFRPRALSLLVFELPKLDIAENSNLLHS